MAWCQRIVWPSRRLCIYILSLLIPFILSPLAASPHKESKCAYVILLVASYWLLEPVPIAATALLPVVLLPAFGIMNSSDVCQNYMKESFLMFIGGLIVAIAVEDCRLHERIALKVLLLIGTEMKWLMMGFMMTTMLLSMWISNTATTAMMVPIVEAVVGKITVASEVEEGLPLSDRNKDSSLPDRKLSDNVEEDGSINSDHQSHGRSKTASSPIKAALLLSVCYSANIGGTGTITGTGTNIVFKALLEEEYPESDDITFATWMMYNVPGMVLCVLIGWFYLQLIYIRCSNNSHLLQTKDRVREIIEKRYRSLGPISFQESLVIVSFLLLVCLWIFRDPKFITGWGNLFFPGVKVGDSAPAIAVAFLLFFLPSDPCRIGNCPPLLEWKTAQRKIPWGIIILVGGGFALADAAQKSGLSTLLGNKLSSMAVLSNVSIVVILCFVTALLTEIITNTIMATILLPVLSQMAVTVGVNPIYLMLPVTVTCSYAFMLPVATVPNAIAFESGNMRTLDMAKPGIVMNIVCCCVQLLMINTLGVAMFSLNDFPSWANRTSVDGQRMETNFTNLSDVSSTFYPSDSLLNLTSSL